MSAPNINQITSQFARMSDQQIQQYAAMHKNDPYTMSLALSEMNRRKETRSAQMGQQQQQPKVVDQAIAGMSQGLPEDSGIAQLPTGPMQYADGGIVAFAEAGQVTDPLAQYEEQIRSEAERQGVDPDMAVRMFRQESGGNKNAVSPKGASGLGQLMLPAAQEMGLSDKDRFDPNKNIPASIGYFKKQQDRFGDPEIAAAAYNYGPGATARHLAQNNGQLNRVGLPKETADYLTKLFPAGSAQAEKVSTFVPAQTNGAEGLIPTGGTATPPAETQEDSGFFSNLGTKLGLSDDSKRNISNLSQALGGSMGAGYIPSMAVRGAAAAEKGIASLTPSVERIVAANPRVQAAQVRQAMARERMLNPELVGPPRSAMQAVSKAPEVAQAAPAGQGITQLAPRIGKAAQASQAARVVGNAASVGRIAGQAESARNLMPSAATIAQNPSGKPYAPFEENFPASQELPKEDKKEIISLAKEAMPENKSKGFSGEDWLMLGLGLLGGKSPYALQNLGDAGKQVIANRIENRKADLEATKSKADIDYKNEQTAASKILTPAQAEYYSSRANEWLRAKDEAAVLANVSKDMATFTKSTLGMSATPEKLEERRQFLVNYYRSQFASLANDNPSNANNPIPLASAARPPLSTFQR